MAMRRRAALAAEQRESEMKIDALPSGWKLWHPIVFGLLAGIGFKLVDPVINAIMGFIR